MLGINTDSTNVNANNLQRYILEDSQQQLHRAAEIQHNLQLQQQVQWQQQPNNQNNSATGNSNNNNSSNSGNSGSNSTSGASPKGKRSATSSQPINWKDPVVQCAISNYFNKKIKLQTELRQVFINQIVLNNFIFVFR